MKTVLVRVHEWTAWIPAQADSSSGLYIHDGLTSLEVDDDEKMSDIQVTAVGKQKHFPMNLEGEEHPVNVKFSLYAFQATLVRVAPEGMEIPTQPVGEDGTVEKPGVVLPTGHKNREARRAEKKSTRKGGK